MHDLALFIGVSLALAVPVVAGIVALALAAARRSDLDLQDTRPLPNSRFNSGRGLRTALSHEEGK